MEKIIAGRHKHVNDNLKDFIYDELEKIEDQYSKLTSGRVILDTEKNLFLTEVKLGLYSIHLLTKYEENSSLGRLIPSINYGNK